MPVSRTFILAVLLVGSVWYFNKMPRYSSGQLAPDFAATLEGGSSFRLSDLRGDYVLLNFWGSWCGPCRKKNPELAALYAKYENKTFSGSEKLQIVAVGIERNKERWKNAIETDRIRWKYHILQEQRFESPIAKLYGIREIPTLYFIDPKGEVISVNDSLEDIDAYLEKNLD